MPLWKTLVHALSTSNSVRGRSLGRRMECLLVYGTSAFDNLPPHLQTPSGSMKRPNCFFQLLNCASFTQSVSALLRRDTVSVSELLLELLCHK